MLDGDAAVEALRSTITAEIPKTEFVPAAATVTNREFFHVTRIVAYSAHPTLAVGSEIEAGTLPNPFFAFYEGARAYSVNTPTGTVDVPAIRFLKEVRNGNIDCPELKTIAVDIARHFVMLTRELLMEQVRRDVNPKAPSRQRCIWLSDNADEAKFWRAKLSPNGRILRLNATGKIHRGDAALLLADSEPISHTLDSARSYWSGKHSEKPELETLFEGRAMVVQVLE